MSDLSIKYEETGNGGKWVATVPGHESAEAYMSYVGGGKGLIIIDHTVVPDELSGRGIGKALLEEAVQFMRDKKLKTLPTCPFAKAQIAKNPDYHDIADPSMLK